MVLRKDEEEEEKDEKAQTSRIRKSANFCNPQHLPQTR